MKKQTQTRRLIRIVGLCLLGILSAFSARGQIVINEIIPPGTVEIISQGATPVNIEGFWLASGSNQIALVDLEINCGGFVLEEGEFLVVEGFNVIDPADGELALFLTNDFDDPDDIIDYVEWGSSGHTYANIAQLAGMWPVGNFVPAWDICESLEYEGTGNGAIHWTSTLNPTECAVNGLDPCIVTNCEITATGLDNILCNNNGTIDIPTDDYITFVLDPEGVDLGDSYTVSVAIGNVFPTMADYGEPTMFQLQAGSAGNGDVMVNITDNADMTCGVGFVVEDPGSCSDNCSIFDSGIFDLHCDNNGTPDVYNDDIIRFTLDPIGFNVGNGYEVEVDPGNVSPDIGSFGSATEFSMQPGSAGGGDLDVMLTDLELPSCNYFFEIEDPGACSNCPAEGGEISTSANLNICANDDIPDVVDFEVTGNVGSFSSWMITTTGGRILSLDSPPYDFEEFPNGNVRVRFISYEFDLQGLEIDHNINNLEGCFDLSNFITVMVAVPAPALIGTADNNTLCTNDGVNDNILVNITGGVGSNATFVITNVPGIIQFTTNSNPINFEGTGAGTVRIRRLHYEDGLMGLEPGTHIDDLEGCYAYSNFINIFRIAPEAGTISTNDVTTVCVDDGISDPINVTVTGAMGGSAGWIITGASGIITSLPAGPPFNFEGSGPGTSLIRHIRYEGAISGLEIGNSISAIGGCFKLSNPIEITKIVGDACNPCQVDGGTISTEDPTTVCAGDGDPDFIDAEILAPEGDFMRWIIADPDGVILSIQIAPPFNFETIEIPLSFIFHISYESGIVGLQVGGDLDNLDGCYDLSNGIAIQAVSPEGGIISTQDTTTVCTDDGQPDLINVAINGASGSFQSWAITNGAGIIISVPAGGPPFNLEGTGVGFARIYHIRYEAGFSGLTVGNSINALQGCHDLSNPILILRLTGEDCTSSTLDLSLNGRFGLNPNPTTGTVVLDTDLELIDEMQVVDMTGRVVHVVERPKHGHILDLGNLDQGIYIVQIRADSAYGLHKLVIQRF